MDNISPGKAGVRLQLPAPLKAALGGVTQPLLPPALSPLSPRTALPKTVDDPRGVEGPSRTALVPRRGVDVPMLPPPPRMGVDVRVVHPDRIGLFRN